MRYLILFLALIGALNLYAGTCTSTSRTAYSANSVLTSTALNADFDQLVTKVNSLDGGCVTDGTLEDGSLNTTDFAVVLNGITQGCKVEYVSATALNIDKCIASVNGNFLKTTSTTSVGWANIDTGAEATGTTYYVYVKTGSASTTLTPEISTTGPNDDGYNGDGDKALARFYNNASGDIDQYSIDQWHGSRFIPTNTNYKTYTPTGAWSSNVTYTGQWRRVGGNMNGWVKVATSGAPTSASLTVNIPSGYVIDTTQVLETTTNASLGLGVSTIKDADVRAYGGGVSYSSTTAVTLTSIQADNAALGAVTTAITQSVPMTWAANDFVLANFSVPITGWGE